MTTKNDNYVAYYRVSTDRQGRSGLGLEAERSAVANYLDGGNWTLLDTFTEVESGRRNDRPELGKALDPCRRRKATLVIAKLDRLARNVAFIANLMDADVEVVALLVLRTWTGVRLATDAASAFHFDVCGARLAFGQAAHHNAHRRFLLHRSPRFVA